MLIFVYGTLRKNFANHFYLEKSKFIGKGITKDKYSLYCNSIPYVYKKKEVSNIVGELYEVDEDTLSKIDTLEGHPHFYYREKVSVIVNGKTYDAYIYFNDNPSGILVPSGDYKNCC